MSVLLRMSHRIGCHSVEYNGHNLGVVETIGGVWSFFANSEEVQLSTVVLRAIADKLDELNGEGSK